MPRLEKRRRFFKSLEARSLKSRSFVSRIADELTTICGTPFFLFLNADVFVLWIIVNMGYIPWIIPFDPYPFGFLTMIVSLEAIILSIFVLISQNRSAYIGTIRDEVHMQINLHAEEEITKILEILADVRKKVGVDKPDPELQKMLEHTDMEYIEKSIIHQLERANRPVWRQLIKEFPYLNNHEKKPVPEGQNKIPDIKPPVTV